MSWINYDPDEFEVIPISRTLGTYPGTTIPFGVGGIEHRRRAPEEVARIKAERLRREEDEILIRADAIRAKRAAEEATNG